ncbi:hypothetical protein AB0K16_56125 [Nonomuraea jabiensis]|uniref:Lipoprotein n=1 Tax=Nonomuraea jabiensis TaxID=882448 RepID=A0A7W9LF36_9ACTN|nr:hypothetical protein [Nonomuraea jabiensis]MBB5781497.1 hypothetical protein [Nonomuraea jabiensis]
MKKEILSTVVFAALTMAAVPAQAAPKDPVGVLKATIAAGHGVRFTGDVTWTDGTDERGARDINGVFQFGKKEIAAFDITTKYGDEHERVIGIGKTGYYSGDRISGLLPEGKTWYKSKNYGMPDSWSQFINPAEPKTLAKLLKNGKTRGNSVSGSITLKELKAVSGWVSAARIGKEHDGLKISYTLTLSSAGLVNRVTSTYTMAADGESHTSTVNTSYTKWGSKVSVTAPDPSTVTTKPR